MDVKTLFLQVKNFILCNNKILNILKGDNIQNDWKEDIFYAVSYDNINNWKNYLGYKEICKELKNQGNKKLISDEDEEWCCSLIKNNILGKRPIQFTFTNSTIYTSLFSSLKLMEKDCISPNTYFYLFSRELWELFGFNKNKVFNGKIPIIEGKNKILIKFNNNKIILLCLVNNDENNIEISNLEKYLIEYIIDFNELKDENEINKLVEKIKNMALPDFKKKIENDFLLIDDKKINIQIKNSLDISLNLNINSIVKYNQNLDQDYVKEMLDSLSETPNIKEVKYICKTIVRKVKYCTYIISSMYSLSQIPGFTEYFFCRENQLLFESKLLFNFTLFLHNLWMNANDEKVFNPTLFLRYLFKKDSKIFDIKSEKLPILFLDKMFDYINEELKNKDNKITEQIKEKKPEFLDNYNSIVSKVFYGIFKQKNVCLTCGKAKNNNLDNDMFKYITIDINKYCDEESKLDTSLSFFYLDDLIEFYFTKQKNSYFCENCKEKKEFKIIGKEIYRFPDILIIYIDWGYFKEEEGFGLEENKLIFDEIIDLTKYAQIKQKERKYEIRSVINYPVVLDDQDKRWKKYITFNKHLVDQKYYCYQPNGKVIEFNSINRRRFVPSVLFYEKAEIIP